MFDWSMRVAQQAATWRYGDASANPMLKAKWKLADKLVYSKIREGTGGRLRLVSSGGAPLSKSLAEFFWSVGIPDLSGIRTDGNFANRFQQFPDQPGWQFRTADSELRSESGRRRRNSGARPMVMQGYYKRPDATREVIDEEGWFHTGDIGYLDNDGYLFITDRMKDLFKTSGGKYVAPQPIENALKQSPYILNAMIVGDRRKFIVALIVPNCQTGFRKSRGTGNHR